MNSTSGKVLVVDDEQDSQLQTKLALIRCGFQCDVASDGSEAMQKISQGCYQAVVTELILPGMSGGELVIRLCGQPRPPVVMVYTRVLEREVHQGLINEGVDAVFYKPVDPMTLAKNVDFLLGGRTAYWRSSFVNSDHRLIHILRDCDGWIQKSGVRIELFRLCIMVLACILFSLGWGHTLDGTTAGICKMFGLCGLAFFFCLELVAYQRAQYRAKVLRWSVERRLSQQLDGAGPACVVKPQTLSV